MSDLTLALSALIGGAVGSLDAIDGAGLSDGDAAVVVLDTGVYHYHLNATSGAAENSPYVISPDTNPGTKRWILVTPQAPASHIRATSNSGQSIPDSTHTYIIFEDETYDTLGEYNPITGIFTVLEGGYYSIVAICSFVNSVWATGKQVQLYLYINNVRYSDGPRIQPEQTTIAKMTLSTSVYLNTSDTIRIDIYHDFGSALSLVATTSYNYLSIDRLI